MAITNAILTNGFSTVNASSYNTASITPTANRLILVSVANRIGADTATLPTLSGNGLTYVQVATQLTGTLRRTTLFRAMGASPTAGAVTIDFGGVTQSHCVWSISEFADVDTSGTNGSGAVVQSNTSTATSVTKSTVTLSAFGTANNAAYSAMQNAADQGTTPGPGFTEIYDSAGSVSENGTTFQVQWKINDNIASCTWTNSTNVSMVACEIDSSPKTTISKLMMMGVG